MSDNQHNWFSDVDPFETLIWLYIAGLGLFVALVAYNEVIVG